MVVANLWIYIIILLLVHFFVIKFKIKYDVAGQVN